MSDWYYDYSSSYYNVKKITERTSFTFYKNQTN